MTNALKDKIIICTYPKKEQDELADTLRANGVTVLSMPMIEITPLPFQLNKNLREYDWLIFTSKNAVEPFASQFKSISSKIAALGPQTANKLQQFNLEPEFTGSGGSATDFGDELMEVLQENEKVLLILGNLAPATLRTKLKEKTMVDRVNVYQTTPCFPVDQELLNRIKNDQYDALIVTSPSAVKALVHELKNPQQQLRMISIGKTTTVAILDFGMQLVATSAESSYKVLAQTTIDYLKKTII